MYAAIFGFMRFVLKRQAGGLGTTDVLVVVLAAEVAGNGFAAEYKSVVEGIILVGTVLFWSYVIEWLSYRLPAFERFFHPSGAAAHPGRTNAPPEHARRTRDAGGTDGSAPRERGRGIADVKRACMEADGRISIVKRDS